VYDSKFDRVIISKLDYIPLNSDIKYDSDTKQFYILHSYPQSEGDPLVITQIVELTDINYFCNKSWTLSYNINTQSWVSFHSYIPNYYIAENNFFYSGINEGCDLEAIAIEETTFTTTTTTSTTLPPTTTTTSTTTTSTPTTTTTTTANIDPPDSLLSFTTYNHGNFTFSLSDVINSTNVVITSADVEGSIIPGCATVDQSDSLGSTLTILAGTSNATVAGSTPLNCSIGTFKRINSIVVNGLTKTNGSTLTIGGTIVTVSISTSCLTYSC
jgi:hypothetical protein